MNDIQLKREKSRLHGRYVHVTFDGGLALKLPKEAMRSMASGGGKLLSSARVFQIVAANKSESTSRAFSSYSWRKIFRDKDKNVSSIVLLNTIKQPVFVNSSGGSSELASVQ
ncbi:unnamed protein product [Phytophthora lilii]|uniref:Unnamed protein product n=1 Tax=Phytophthora lilii TaxID=2077276 RepID=A0A9W6WN62_9STRA|nr:unnamed protein product [Phytophthora lilii]